MQSYALTFDLSLEAVERLVLAQEELEEAIAAAGAEATWVEAARIRVGLKVLRGLDEAMVERVTEAVTHVSAALVPFKVSARGVYVFPDPRSPRLLYAAIHEGLDLVEGLQRVLNVHLERVGVPLDPRPYQAWALVGRVRTPRQRVDLGASLGPGAAVELGTSTITHITLHRTELDRYGVRSAVLRRFRLGGARPDRRRP